MTRALLAALLAGALAQDPGDPLKPCWKIPPAHFARYQARMISFDAGGEEKLAPNNHRWVGLLDTEIADGRRYLPPAHDWHEIPLIAGFTLPARPLRPGKPADHRIEIENGWEYAPLVLAGTVTRAAADEPIDGAPCAVLESRLKIQPHPKTKLAARQRAVVDGAIDATIHYDAAAGLVRRLRFEFRIAFAGKEKPDVHEQREQVDLVALLPLRHTAFEREVIAAIDKGVAWIWSHYREADGRWGDHYDHKTGPTALALLAILKGTVARDDPRVARALQWLLGEPMVHTYDVAVSLMALEAFHAPSEKGAPAGPVDPVHAKWAAEAARWLEGNGGAGLWSYPSTDASRDLSNSQYAILGLAAAARLGAPVDADVLRKAAERYLAAQQRQGPRVELDLRGEDAPGRTTQSKAPAEARGWSYRDNPADDPYGSMTLGGIGALTLLDGTLRRMGAAKYDRRDQALVAAGIRDGWAWMERHWTVKGNPARGRDHYLYMLYALERAAMLGGVARVGGHDWYAEGAQLLISNQAASGWMAYGRHVWLHDVCFAVLFLKRATMRVESK